MAKKIRWNDPWAEFAEEIRAETRKYNTLRNEVGRAFQPLQEAAYETYCEWEAEMATQDEPIQASEVDVGGTVIHENFDELKQRREKERRRLWELNQALPSDQEPLQSAAGAPTEYATEMEEEASSWTTLRQFEVDGTIYTPQSYPGANIIITPAPPHGKTHLVLTTFTEDIYELRNVEGEDSCEIIGLEVGEYQLFVGLRDDGEECSIEFSP